MKARFPEMSIEMVRCEGVGRCSVPQHDGQSNEHDGEGVNLDLSC